MVKPFLLFLPFCMFFSFSIAQIQTFEADFTIVNHPEEFLPGWTGNDVRATAARIFQASGEGIARSKALGVQVLSTFNGIIETKIPVSEYSSPKIGFFAKTRQNGSGTRPVLLFVSFSKGGGPYSTPLQIGDDHLFPNINQDYNPFEVLIPEVFIGETELTVRIEVRIGPGTGTAARFFMDNFGIFEADDLIDPIKIKSSYLYNPYTLFMSFDRDIEQISSGQILIPSYPLSKVLMPTDSTLLIISATDYKSSELTFLLNGIKEKGKDLSQDISHSFKNNGLRLGEIRIIDSQWLSISFNSSLHQASGSQTGSYLFAGRTPQRVILEENGFEALLEFQESLELGKNYDFSVRNLVGFEGSDSRQIRYEDFIEAVSVSEPKKIVLEHAVALDPEQLRETAFRITDREDISFNIGSLSSSGLLILNSSLPLEENTVYELQVPPRVSARGLFLSGSRREVVYDTTAPRLINVIPLSELQVMAIFSEPMDPVFAGITAFYSIDGAHPRTATLQQQPHQVLLQWQTAFERDIVLALEVDGLSDVAGNFMEAQRFSFSFGSNEIIGYKNLVINEVMAAPRPNQALPNVEYVELYNATERALPLSGLSLSNRRRSTALPPAILEAGSYLLLVPRNHVAQFTRFGPVLGLSNWPALVNSGDRVLLRDIEGRVLDSLVYNTASYGSSSIAQGGFSLEIINPHFKCQSPTNLRPSTATQRGTPGAKNSVINSAPDLLPFTISRALVKSGNQVVIEFNKPVSTDLSKVTIQIKPGLGHIRLSAGTTVEQLLVEVADTIEEGIRFQLVFSNLRDCSGMALKGQETIFVKPSKASSGDVVINEVLFNPRSGTPKFVEIHNTSPKFINLLDWKLANLNSAQEIANRRTLFAKDFILEPSAFVVFTTDAEKLKQEYPRGKEETFVVYPSLPSYPIVSGNVVLLNPEEDVAELFSYHERMHHRLLKEVRGVSLERISPWFPVDDPSNWNSASSSAGFATPGYQNSHFSAAGFADGIEVMPKVFFPDAVGDRSFTRISYKVEQAGQLATIKIYGINGLEVKEICQNAIWGAEGFYIWDGTDQAGRKVRPGYYLVWVQIFDLKGKVQQTKKTVVVGTNL
jgi:hypothetical protein